MEAKEESESVSSTFSRNEEGGKRWASRNKKNAKKKITLVYLLKVICSSQETCLDWLKNKGLIPKIMFCPNCSKKMKFESQESAIDGYVWICKECRIDPPQYSSRHGSWLETKDAPLVDILLFTYLWSHGFDESKIVKEMNMPLEEVKDWDVTYNDICDALHRKSLPDGEDCDDQSTFKSQMKAGCVAASKDYKIKILKISNKEPPAVMWRKKNRYKDPFLEFLKDADSL